MLGPMLMSPRATMQVLSIRQIGSADGERFLCHTRRVMKLIDGHREIAKHEIDLVLTFTVHDGLISRCHIELLDPGR